MDAETARHDDRPRVPTPAHVPPEALVDIDYHTFGGAGDPAFKPGQTNQEAWKAVQDSPGPELRWTPHNGGHWITTSAATIAAVLDDPATFSSKYIALPKEVGEIYDFKPLTLDPPEHKPYRSILNPLLSHKVVREKEEMSRALAIELIDGFKDHGECDYVSEFANILPVAVFHSLIGMPPEQREELRQLAQSGDQTKPETVAVMLDAIEDVLKPHLKARRADPGDDLFSGLLHSNLGDEPISDEEAMVMCKQLFVAGFHTTAGTLGFITHRMAKDPALRAELRDNPKRINVKLDELMRRYALVGIPRTATKDTELAGQTIKEGDPVYVPLILYNLDETLFPNPMEVDFNRRGEIHAGFGRGIHRCPGSVLGIVEISVSLQEWLARIPDFEIADEASVRVHGGGVAAIQHLPLRWDV